jgi:hypothetical protein
MFSSQHAAAPQAAKHGAPRNPHDLRPFTAATAGEHAGIPVSPPLSALHGRTPHSEPAADKPSETKAFPQPSSAPSPNSIPCKGGLL